MMISTIALALTIASSVSAAPASASRECLDARAVADAPSTLQSDDADPWETAYTLAARCDAATAVAFAELVLQDAATRDDALDELLFTGLGRPESIALAIIGADASAEKLRAATAAIDLATIGFIERAERMLADESGGDAKRSPTTEDELADVRAMLLFGQLLHALRSDDVDRARAIATKLDLVSAAPYASADATDGNAGGSAHALIAEYLDEQPVARSPVAPEWVHEPQPYRCGFAMTVTSGAGDRLRSRGDLDGAIRWWLESSRGGIAGADAEPDLIYLLLLERYGSRAVLRDGWREAERTIWRNHETAGWTLFGVALPLPAQQRDRTTSRIDELDEAALSVLVRKSRLYELIHQ